MRHTSPPRHYDKYTYSARRRPEGPEDNLSLASPNRRSFAQRPPTAYEACVAGVAPLLKNSHGFAVAEDGTVQSRFVSAPRFSAPSIAMVPVPMCVVPSPNATHRILTSPPTSPNQIQATTLGRAVTEIVPTTEVEAWKRFAAVASRDFTDEELGQLNWDTMVELLQHYQIRNPIDVARIQLAWKRRQGMLPSDRLDQFAPVEDLSAGVMYYPQIATVRYPNVSPPRHSVGSTSPRRDSPTRYVPGYKVKTKYDHVSPKVDTGRKSPVRARTPTRQ